MNAHTFRAPVAGHWSTDEGTEMANRYAGMKREDLAFGEKSDLEMANAVFMADRNSLDLIGLQTAAKDRIRWLSAQLAASRAEAANLRAALTPTSNTKAAYIGEFSFGVTLRAGNEEAYRSVEVPWTAVKEIMAAILAHAEEPQP